VFVKHSVTYSAYQRLHSFFYYRLTMHPYAMIECRFALTINKLIGPICLLCLYWVNSCR